MTTSTRRARNGFAEGVGASAAVVAAFALPARVVAVP